MEAIVKKAKHIAVGDIFFIDLIKTDNEHLTGGEIDLLLTGAYCCFVADDEMADNEILVNGGHSLFVDEEEKLLVIGHYSKVVKAAEEHGLDVTI